MTRTRQAIIAFWIFIIGMMLWEFYDYNSSMTKKAQEHPTPDHFFFHQHGSDNKPAKAEPPKGPDVEQIGFDTKNNMPSSGFFTCVMTVKNKGRTKAINIQAEIRPYKGITRGNEDVGNSDLTPIPDTDPLAQISQWVTVPDLDPDATATVTASFLIKPGLNPGLNPKPKITFEAEKEKTLPKLPGHAG